MSEEVRTDDSLNLDDRQHEVIQVSVEAKAMLSNGTVVRVRDVASHDLLSSVRHEDGMSTLFRGLRKRLIRACNIKGARAQELLGQK